MQPKPKPSLLLCCMAWSLCGYLALATAASGCHPGKVSSGSPALTGVATIDGLPPVTGSTTLSVQGTRPPDTAVTALFANGATQALCSRTTTRSTVWSGTLSLQPGMNAFVLVATDAANNTQQSLPYRVEVVLTAPGALTVDHSYGGTVYVYMAQGVPMLTGTKDTDANLAINGIEVVPIDGRSAWQYTLPALGVDTPLNLQLTTHNAAAQSSEPVALSVQATTVPAVQLSSYPRVTNRSRLTLTGTHAVGAQVHLVWQGQPADASLEAADANHFAFTADLRGTGVQDDVVAAVFYQTIGGVQGPYTVARVRYDIVPPLPPVVTSPATFGQPGPMVLPSSVTPANLQVTGTLPDATAHLCLTVNGPLDCSITAPPASQFAVNVPLQPGHNALVMRAVDPAGNSSAVTRTDIYVPRAPAIVVHSPDGTAALHGDSTTVSGEVYLAPEDMQDPNIARSIAIAAVQVCMDGVNCQMADVDGGQFSATVALRNLTSGSHRIDVQATNSLGVTYASAPPTGMVDANIAPGTAGGSASFIYASDVPTWLNGAEGSGLAARAPAIAVDAAGNAHIVWEDYCTNNGAGACTVSPAGTVGPDIFYTTRSAAGVWAPSIRTVSDLGARDGQSREPTIAIDQAGLVHVAWSDNGNVTWGGQNQYGIFHRSVDPATGAWSSVDLVAGQDGYSAKQPHLAANTYSSGPGVHLTWQHDATTPTVRARKDIYYAAWHATLPLSPNQPFGTWTAPLQVTRDPNAALAYRPKVAMGPDQHVTIAWHACQPPHCTGTGQRHDVYLIDVANPNSVDPLGAVLVTDSPVDRDGLLPGLFVGSDNVRYVVWQGLSLSGGADATVPAIFMRQYRGRAPDTREPAAVCLSAGETLASRAPAAALQADGLYTVAWSQAEATGPRASHLAVRLGHIVDGLAPSSASFAGDGNLTINVQVAMGRGANGTVHAVWDNSLSPATATSLSPSNRLGAFYTPLLLTKPM